MNHNVKLVKITSRNVLNVQESEPQPHPVHVHIITSNKPITLVKNVNISVETVPKKPINVLLAQPNPSDLNSHVDVTTVTLITEKPSVLNVPTNVLDVLKEPTTVSNVPPQESKPQLVIAQLECMMTELENAKNVLTDVDLVKVKLKTVPFVTVTELPNHLAIVHPDSSTLKTTKIVSNVPTDVKLVPLVEPVKLVTPQDY